MFILCSVHTLNNMKSDAFIDTATTNTDSNSNGSDENTIKRRHPNFFSIIFIFILLISLSVTMKPCIKV